MALSEKERTRIYQDEFGIIDKATGKKVKFEVNDAQAIGDDITITMPLSSTTLGSRKIVLTGQPISDANSWAALFTLTLTKTGNMVNVAWERTSGSNTVTLAGGEYPYFTIPADTVTTLNISASNKFQYGTVYIKQEGGSTPNINMWSYEVGNIIYFYGDQSGGACGAGTFEFNTSGPNWITLRSLD